jgi:hypothetical protein
MSFALFVGRVAYRVITLTHTHTPVINRRSKAALCTMPPRDLAQHPQATRKFVEYLAINTCQPAPDYATCLRYLQAYAAELQLPIEWIEVCGPCIPCIKALSHKSRSPLS